MDIDILAKDLNMTAADLLTYVEQYNNKYDLGIESYHALTSKQYNVLRALLDKDYLVRLLLDRKAYDSTPGYMTVRHWISDKDLNGLSTKEVKKMVGAPAVHLGPQAISAAMRANGYKIRVVYLEGGSQGRRWFKETMLTSEDTIPSNTPSFF